MLNNIKKYLFLSSFYGIFVETKKHENEKKRFI